MIKNIQPNPRTVRLREIMAEHNLKSPAIGLMLNRSKQTVRLWKCEEKVIPDHMLQLLEVKIAALPTADQIDAGAVDA